jgi:hypothetical protein
MDLFGRLRWVDRLIYLPIYLPTCLSIYLSICPSIYRSLYNINVPDSVLLFNAHSRLVVELPQSLVPPREENEDHLVEFGGANETWPPEPLVDRLWHAENAGYMS